MGKTKSYGQYGSKKRKFCGNKHTQSQPCKSASAKKVPMPSKSSSSKQKIEGYRLLDMNNLINFVQQFPCSKCTTVNGYKVTEVRVGLKSKIKFMCKGDQCLTSFILACPSQSKNINCRFQMAMFSIGSNRTQAARFLCDMNMPPPITGNSWNDTKSMIHSATRDIANNSMMKAGNETKDSSGNTVTVSCDGTWQKKDFRVKMV